MSRSPGWLKGLLGGPARASRPRSTQAGAPESVRDGTWEDDLHPWLAGAVEWSERYGTLLAEARRWRLAAFVALFVALVAIVGAVSLARETQFVPYIVQVDAHGFAVPIKPADRKALYDEPTLMHACTEWVLATRTVWDDAHAQHFMIDKAFARMSRHSPAWKKATAWFSEHNPLTSIGSRRVEVEITRAFPMSSAMHWTVEWTERESSQGQDRESRFTAFLQLEVSRAVLQKDIIKNPGIYIADYTISQLESSR
jgi:type IV secretion system protein TrbF